MAGLATSAGREFVRRHQQALSRPRLRSRPSRVGIGFDADRPCPMCTEPSHRSVRQGTHAAVPNLVGSAVGTSLKLPRLLCARFHHRSDGRFRAVPHGHSRADRCMLHGTRTDPIHSRAIFTDERLLPEAGRCWVIPQADLACTPLIAETAKDRPCMNSSRTTGMS